MNIKDQVDSFIQLLTDSENQPHQYINDPDNLKMKIIGIFDDWQPTADNINNLPRKIKDYIHDLISRCDPAGTIRENTILRDTVISLEKELKEN